MGYSGTPGIWPRIGCAGRVRAVPGAELRKPPRPAGGVPRTPAGIRASFYAQTESELGAGRFPRRWWGAVPENWGITRGHREVNGEAVGRWRRD